MVGAVAIAMTLSGCDWLVAPEADIIYPVPEHFNGWMCVDFDVKTAPPLPPREEGAGRPAAPGFVHETSDREPGWHSEVWVEAGAQRRALPNDVRSGQMIVGAHRKLTISAR